jgi:gas vesicle protein
MKNSSNILLGILGAAAAGVVIGMIIAPRKGSDLRSDLKNSAGDFTRKLGDLLAKGKEKYDELRSQATEDGRNLKNDARDLAHEAKSAYKEYSGKVEDAYTEFSNDASKAYKKAKS